MNPKDYDEDGNNIVPCPICLNVHCLSKEGGKCPEEAAFIKDLKNSTPNWKEYFKKHPDERRNALDELAAPTPSINSIIKEDDCAKYGHVYVLDSMLDTCQNCKKELMLLTEEDYKTARQSIYKELIDAIEGAKREGVGSWDDDSDVRNATLDEATQIIKQKQEEV